MSKKTTPEHTWIWGALGTFVCTLIIARFIIDVALYGTPIHSESWSSINAWIAPFGFALISVFAYWYRTKKL